MIYMTFVQAKYLNIHCVRNFMNVQGDNQVVFLGHGERHSKAELLKVTRGFFWIERSTFYPMMYVTHISHN